tara:strand:+ start:101 stop:577 length:477 start_codon:yes stop_codon:yes gene_type:complete
MKNKFVYRHKNPKTLEVFYVGFGNASRPYDVYDRNDSWFAYIKEYGDPIVEIIKENISAEEAKKIENALIKRYGRVCNGSGSLVNIQPSSNRVSESTKLKMSNSQKERYVREKKRKKPITKLVRWYNNGRINKRLPLGHNPEGWVLGRLNLKQRNYGK